MYIRCTADRVRPLCSRIHTTYHNHCRSQDDIKKGWKNKLLIFVCKYLYTIYYVHTTIITFIRLYITILYTLLLTCGCRRNNGSYFLTCQNEWVLLLGRYVYVIFWMTKIYYFDCPLTNYDNQVGSEVSCSAGSKFKVSKFFKPVNVCRY